MHITNVTCSYVPEKFIHSFGFKGSTLSGVWQTAVAMESGSCTGIGEGVQSVLWSDSSVFAAYGEEKSNRLMFDVTRYAVNLISDTDFEHPSDIIHSVFRECKAYAQQITSMDITDTFVLNSLVPVDFAAWHLWAQLNGIRDFDRIYKGSARNSKLANIPLITYSTSLEEVERMAKDGVCIFKIKLGADPEGDGSLDKMLEWDKRRAQKIHNILKDIPTPYTDCGNAVYYFDANGRYDTKERLENLVEFLHRRGIARRTVLFEEPFAPDNKINIADIPLNFAADESAHSLDDVKERIALGYRTITLKPIAKTLSVTIDMADYAAKAGVQCFCADLTVNPLMVQWNKNFAARLKPLDGMKIGVVESNGAQNYINWETMKGYVPGGYGNDDTVYTLGDSFYTTGGGIFETPQYYAKLAKRGETE
ncbi:MAG: L-alanine-DL-glutamate epimerase [Clostridia bacterium]|nr:L-alanine-DL-glutamate epimerase [Clostridia bacterium]